LGRSDSHRRERTWRVQEHTAGGFARAAAPRRTAPRPPPPSTRAPRGAAWWAGTGTRDGTDPLRHGTAAQQTCDPASDYKRFNRSNVSIRPWSWNYRSCWHQTCPPVVTHHCLWIASIPSSTGEEDQWNCCSSSLPRRFVGIGQFARLLPTLVVVAVSQAPSPESNPDSPLPVNATVVHDTTVQADRSEVRATKPRL